MINLAQRYVPAPAELETVGGQEIVKVYTSLDEEYKAIRKESGFIDYSAFTTIRVSGDGAAEYLDGLCTKDIQFLNIDMLAECLVLDADGSALGMVWVLNNGDDYILYIAPESADSILAFMNGQTPDDGSVEITEITDKALVGIEGHNAWQIVRDVLDVDVDGLPLRGIQDAVDFTGAHILLARIGRSGEYGYLALGDPDTIARYVDACFSYAEKEGLGLRFVGNKAMEICMLETGQPNFRYENSTVGNVFELGQQWMIQYEKENFSGRDALMDLFGAGQSRASVLFVSEGCVTLENGAPVFLEDEMIGSVVHAMDDPGNGKTIGLAILRRDLAVSGITLTAGPAKAAITTVSSPVLRPRSWDERIGG